MTDFGKSRNKQNEVLVQGKGILILKDELKWRDYRLKRKKEKEQVGLNLHLDTRVWPCA